MFDGGLSFSVLHVAYVAAYMLTYHVNFNYSVILHRKTAINITFQLFPNSSIIVFISVFANGNIEIKL